MSSAVVEDQAPPVRRANGTPTSAPPELVVGPAAAGAVSTAAVPAVAAAPLPPARKSRRRAVLGVLLTLAVAAAIVTTIVLVRGAGYESTDDAAIDGHVITISPQVAAAVRAVHVDDNAAVHAGDLLVELDPTDYEVARDQARATQAAMAGKLTQASTGIASAEATRDAAKADVDVAQANAASAHADFARYTALQARTPGAVSKQQFDQATAAEMGNAAQVEQARARLAQAVSAIATQRAMVEAAKGDVAKAAADVHRAEVNLSYCTIRAPQDGQVTRKAVEPGSYVQVGAELFALVPTDVWVTANFKETQLDHMRANQPVTVTVDAYPGLTLHGHVDSFQLGTGSRFSMLPAENATGNFVKVVQRVPVKLLLDGHPGADRDHPLALGMSVTPEVSIR